MNIKFKYIEKRARLQLFSPRCAKPARKPPPASFTTRDSSKHGA